MEGYIFRESGTGMGCTIKFQARSQAKNKHFHFGHQQFHLDCVLSAVICHITVEDLIILKKILVCLVYFGRCLTTENAGSIQRTVDVRV